MSALIEVILPVFLVIGFGYAAAWRGLFSDEGVDAIMRFAQNFAIPCLLFQAMSSLDLAGTYDAALLVSFYSGAFISFLAGLFGARLIFGRPWEDSVAIGFCALFSNSVLLGLAITERAYGTAALSSNYAIVSLHAPFCYGVGMTAMEIVRNRGGSPVETARRVGRAMMRNVLMIAIGLGLLVNLSGLPVPDILDDAVELVARTALPTALFAMGCVLYRYRPEGDMRIVAYICVLSLLLHPAITWTLGKATGLSTEAFRSALITAAMAPGVNGYVFANMYGVARRVAATAVLTATLVSIITAWLWLSILP